MSDQETIVTSAIRVIAQQIKDDEIDGVKAISELLEHQVQAREQQLLTKLAASLPDDTLVTTKYGYNSREKQYGFRMGIAEAKVVIERYREGL